MTRMWRFRPVIFLPASKPCGSIAELLLSCLTALAVDDRGRGARLAPGPLARLDVERVVDPLQRAD
jgi:hypothetical protein